VTIETDRKDIQSFESVESVLANNERFKVKLGIGSDAYTSLRTSKLVGQLWDMGGAAGTGAGLAASGTVASTFFGSFWTSVGLATAATPVGWIVGAAVVSGGAYYGVARLFKSYSSSRVDEIPKFLNSGLDVLATATLDLIGGLALKVAAIDGKIDEQERIAIKEYFVEEWGYDPNYVHHALQVLEHNIEESRLSEMTASLVEFSNSNPDCNSMAMQSELKRILVEVAEADGYIDEREEMAIDRIEKALADQNSFFASTGRVISESASGIGNLTASTASGVQSAMSSLAGRLWSKKQ